jgi:hypothetical protein
VGGVRVATRYRADLVSHLVWSASSRLVTDVWVAGTRVVADGACFTVDVERAVRLARDAG